MGVGGVVSTSNSESTRFDLLIVHFVATILVMAPKDDHLQDQTGQLRVSKVGQESRLMGTPDPRRGLILI